MIIMLCLIVWILADISTDNARSNAYYNRQAERRHKELMEATKAQNKSPAKKRTDRRVLYDEDGNIVAEEEVELWE